MLDPDTGLLVLNILGPFDGRRIRSDVVRSNVNAKSVHPLTPSQWDDVVRELKSRNWISERFNDFGQAEIGITTDGQLVREKNNQ